MRERIGIVDSGGRGAALAHAYAQSSEVEAIIGAPGNTLWYLNAERKPVFTFDFKTVDIDRILTVGREQRVTFFDVCQDNAVAANLATILREAGYPTIGPSAAAGRVESRKDYARNLIDSIPGMSQYQPQYRVFQSEIDGYEDIRSHWRGKSVVKAVGLCEGKGVIMAKNSDESIVAIGEMKRFGKEGETYLIEEWLENEDGTPGKEFSAYAVSDGSTYQMVGKFVDDYKKVNDHDEGPNTGSMGCSTPCLDMTPELAEEVDGMFGKIFNGLKEAGNPYNGVLYLSGMLIKREGRTIPMIVELNSRWGDPEAEVVVPSIMNGLFTLSSAVVEGRLQFGTLKMDDNARVSVAIASSGYPDDYSAVKGKRVYGIDRAMRHGIVYGAGVRRSFDKGGAPIDIATGGRLLHVVGMGPDVVSARVKAYAAASQIYVEGNNGHYRTDIGSRDLEQFYSRSK